MVELGGADADRDRSVADGEVEFQRQEVCFCAKPFSESRKFHAAIDAIKAINIMKQGGGKYCAPRYSSQVAKE